MTHNKVIPVIDIKEQIIILAVTWGDAYNFEIWQTHKLASDIQNLFEEIKEGERRFSLKECPHCQISPVMCKCCGETL